MVIVTVLRPATGTVPGPVAGLSTVIHYSINVMVFISAKRLYYIK